MFEQLLHAAGIWPCQSPLSVVVDSNDCFWAHSTMSVSGFATGRPSMCMYMTYLAKIPWFCHLPPYLKVWRFLEDSLPFRCLYRLELTLVLGARDLNSVIQQTVRSEIWCSEDCELQSIERVAFTFIWKESLKEFSDELKYGIVLQRTISDPTRWIVFLFGLCSTLLIHTMNNPPGAEIMTSKCCPGKPKIHESEISLIILMF